MNNGARDDATDRPISLKNEATPDAAVFAGANPAPTAGAIVGTGDTLGRGGSLFQSDDNDEDFEEYSDQRHVFPRIVRQGCGNHRPAPIFDWPEFQQ